MSGGPDRVRKPQFGAAASRFAEGVEDGMEFEIVRRVGPPGGIRSNTREGCYRFLYMPEALGSEQPVNKDS